MHVMWVLPSIKDHFPEKSLFGLVSTLERMSIFEGMEAEINFLGVSFPIKTLIICLNDSRHSALPSRG